MALAWEVLLIFVLIQLPSVRDAFGITRPSFGMLAVILGFGAIVFISMEVIKAVLRRRMVPVRRAFVLSSEPAVRY